MYKYIAWRLILIIPALIGASAVIFLIMRVMPGDITLVISGDVVVNPEVKEALRRELGLNDPFYIQYGRWLWSMGSGGFGGRSLESQEAIGSIIGRQLPVTLLLAGYTMLLSIVVSMPLGVISAILKDRWPDRLIRVATLGGLAFPHLWLALLVLLGLLLLFRWSPPIVYDAPWVDLRDHLKLMCWPSLILAWEYSSHLVRITRSSMLNSFSQAYITTAWSKGLPRYAVVLRHALPNTLIPSVTMLGLQVGTLLGGALILETIFGLPGIGRGLVQAAVSRDYPVVQSLTTLLVLVALIVNLLVDMLYKFIDPRISYST